SLPHSCWRRATVRRPATSYRKFESCVSWFHLSYLVRLLKMTSPQGRRERKDRVVPFLTQPPRAAETALSPMGTSHGGTRPRTPREGIFSNLKNTKASIPQPRDGGLRSSVVPP